MTHSNDFKVSFTVSPICNSWLLCKNHFPMILAHSNRHSNNPRFKLIFLAKALCNSGLSKLQEFKVQNIVLVSPDKSMIFLENLSTLLVKVEGPAFPEERYIFHFSFQNKSIFCPPSQFDTKMIFFLKFEAAFYKVLFHLPFYLLLNYI